MEVRLGQKQQAYLMEKLASGEFSSADDIIDRALAYMQRAEFELRERRAAKRQEALRQLEASEMKIGDADIAA